jgi:predicted HD superfamily hydrolase involved in NAD metabolism
MDVWLNPYLDFLERILTPNRLRHSLGVMQVMGELTPIYGLNRDQALLAGLLHDAAKDLPPDQRERIILEAGIPILTDCDRDYSNYLHGPVGAYFVQKELGVDDPLVLDAISMHTFCGAGENFDAPLVWCLRFSDLLEPNRVWNDWAHWIRDGIPRLRQLAFSGLMPEAALFQTGLIIRFFQEVGYPVHSNHRRIYHERCSQLGVDETWFGF